MLPSGMPRGRLIFPFLVELAQLDTTTTEGSIPLNLPGGGTSGYDSVFRTPIKVLQHDTDQIGASSRAETTLQVRAQIEPQMFDQLTEMLSGSSPQSQFAIVCHFSDLEKAGLVDSTGRPKIYERDRITQILTLKGEIVQTIPTPPGLYCVEVQPRGWMGGNRNLLLLKFEARDESKLSA